MLFARLISHQPAVLFSQNKLATSNQPTVLFSQNKPAPAISHQPTEQAQLAITVVLSKKKRNDGSNVISHIVLPIKARLSLYCATHKSYVVSSLICTFIV
jgi:hypothetical protein